MAYDIHVGTDELSASLGDPILQIEDDEHEALFIGYRHVVKDMPILERMSDFYGDVKEISSHEFQALKAEIMKLQRVGLEEKADLLITRLLKVIESVQERDCNLYCAPD